MNDRQFYFQLTWVSVLSTTILAIIYYFLPIREYVELGIIALVFFIALSMVIHRMARKVSTAQNLNAFTHLIMYNLMVKLFLSFVIILMYYYIVKPTERLFILPYVVVYLIFTIFEAVFLSNLARIKHDSTR